MKPRDYCCCAIPVVNFGIYSTLAEQFALGILAGTLSIATPESNTTAPCPLLLAEHHSAVVGAATPSLARWIFAAICYVGAMIQILGFIGVARVCILHCLTLPWLFTPSGHRKTPCFLEDTPLFISLSQ